MNVSYTTDNKLVLRGDLATVDRLLKDLTAIGDNDIQFRAELAAKGAILTLSERAKPAKKKAKAKAKKKPLPKVKIPPIRESFPELIPSEEVVAIPVVEKDDDKS